MDKNAPKLDSQSSDKGKENQSDQLNVQTPANNFADTENENFVFREEADEDTEVDLKPNVNVLPEHKNTLQAPESLAATTPLFPSSLQITMFCRFCLQSFTCFADLCRHDRTHTGVKPFLCTFAECTEPPFAEMEEEAKGHIRQAHQQHDDWQNYVEVDQRLLQREEKALRKWLADEEHLRKLSQAGAGGAEGDADEDFRANRQQPENVPAVLDNGEVTENETKQTISTNVSMNHCTPLPIAATSSTTSSLTSSHLLHPQTVNNSTAVEANQPAQTAQTDALEGKTSDDDDDDDASVVEVAVCAETAITNFTARNTAATSDTATITSNQTKNRKRKLKIENEELSECKNSNLDYMKTGSSHPQKKKARLMNAFKEEEKEMQISKNVAVPADYYPKPIPSPIPRADENADIDDDHGNDSTEDEGEGSSDLSRLSSDTAIEPAFYSLSSSFSSSSFSSAELPSSVNSTFLGGGSDHRLVIALRLPKGRPDLARYVCQRPGCSRPFRHLALLKAHDRKHRAECDQFYRCRYRPSACRQTASAKGNLLTHIHTHHTRRRRPTFDRRYLERFTEEDTAGLRAEAEMWTEAQQRAIFLSTKDNSQNDAAEKESPPPTFAIQIRGANLRFHYFCRRPECPFGGEAEFESLAELAEHFEADCLKGDQPSTVQNTAAVVADAVAATVKKEEDEEKDEKAEKVEPDNQIPSTSNWAPSRTVLIDGRLYICCPRPNCSRQFRQMAQLREHDREVHRQLKVYSCGYPLPHRQKCLYSAAKKDDILKHIFIAHININATRPAEELSAKIGSGRGGKRIKQVLEKGFRLPGGHYRTDSLCNQLKEFILINETLLADDEKALSIGAQNQDASSLCLLSTLQGDKRKGNEISDNDSGIADQKLQEKRFFDFSATSVPPVIIQTNSFTCEHCGRNGFQSFGDYRKHDRKHSKIQPFTCKLCPNPASFTQKSTANHHFRKVHQVKEPSFLANAKPEDYIEINESLLKEEKDRLLKRQKE